MASKLKSKLIKFIKSKRINIFLMFLGVSFGILILTKLSKSYTNTIAFSIKTLNVPDADVIFSDSTAVLNISLKTHGFNFLEYYFKKPVITLDFSDKITKTDSVYIWNSKTAYSDIISQFDKNIEILNINPDTLRFRYDISEIKIVPIKLATDVHFASGFDLLENYKLKPDSVKIIGPKSVVEKIHEIVTDTLKLKAVNSDVNQILKLNLPQGNEVLKISEHEVMIYGKVEKFTEGNLKVPVSIKNVPDSLNIKFFPKQVSVSYYTSLSNFKQVKPDDFEIICDFNEAKKNNPYLYPLISKRPTGVKNVKINQNQIEYIITE